ncbi:MAG: hypothetical protein U0798_15045 [Gemmataceae bacterium]
MGTRFGSPINLRTHRAIGVSWSPEDPAFSSSYTKRTWFEDSASSLFSDAGTTPAALGDQIFQWNDKVSGSYVQATAIHRPTRKSSGVYFDGATRYLKNTGTAHSTTQFSACFSIRPNANGGDYMCYSLNSDLIIFEVYLGGLYISIGGSANAGYIATGLQVLPMVVSIQYDGTQSTNATRLKIWIDGVSKTLTFAGTIPASIAATTGAAIGVRYGVTAPWNGYVRGGLLTDGVWTTVDRQNVENYFLTTLNPWPAVWVACCGNSRTRGRSTSGDTNGNFASLTAWPAVMGNALGDSYHITNYGIDSQTTDQMTSYAATHAFADVAFCRSPKKIIIGYEGLNCIYFGATGTQAYDSDVAFKVAAKAAGFHYVVIPTTGKDGYIGGSPWTPAMQTERIARNSLLVSNAVSDGIDGIGRVDLDANVGDAANTADTTYFYSDQEHWVDGGQTVVAGIIGPVVSSF